MSVSEKASFPLGNGNLVTSQKPAAEVIPNPGTPDNFKSPLDFSTVTVQQLGITPESFVKNSAGKKSISVLLKFKNNCNITQFVPLACVPYYFTYLNWLTLKTCLIRETSVDMHSSSSLAGDQVWANQHDYVPKSELSFLSKLEKIVCKSRFDPTHEIEECVYYK